MGGIHQVLSTNIVPAAGGGGYVPVDPEWPSLRKQHIVREDMHVLIAVH